MATFRYDPIPLCGSGGANWGDFKRYRGYRGMLREISAYPEFNRKTKTALSNPMLDERDSSRQMDRIRSWKRCKIKHQWMKHLSR